MSPSPVRENGATRGADFICDLRALSRYRVLRAASSRGGPRSVDGECAGSNAVASVNEVEPRQTANFRGGRAGMTDRLNSGHAKAIPFSKEMGTTEVQDHSMHTRWVTVRYADDAVFIFTDEATAQSFHTALQARLQEAGLSLNLSKSAIVPFSATAPEGFVSFLGFTLYWGHNPKKERLLKLKQQPRGCTAALKPLPTGLRR